MRDETGRSLASGTLEEEGVLWRAVVDGRSRCVAG